MSDFLGDFGSKLNKSVYVIPIFIAFVILFIVGAGLSVESYFTNLAGYEGLPTQKVHEWVFPLVALLPQIGFITFFYIYLHDTTKRWALWLVFIFHLADMFTDVSYKTKNFSTPFAVWIVAILESELLFTIGAHILTTLSMGMIFELLPDFIEQFGTVIHKAGAAFGNAADKMVSAGTAQPTGKRSKPAGFAPERES